MKKTFKRAGVAVLSMAMLLSMGAMTAITSNAAVTTTAQTVTIADTYGGKYNVFRVLDASVASGGLTYTYSFAQGFSETDCGYSIDQIASTSHDNASAMKALADALVTDSGNATPVNATPIDVSSSAQTIDLTPGYYLIVSTEGTQMTVAPTLISVRSDDAARTVTPKTSSLTLDKYITGVEKGDAVKVVGTTDGETKSNSAQGAVGNIVSYAIETKTPKYAPTVTTLTNSYQIVDTPSAGLDYVANSIVVYADLDKDGSINESTEKIYYYDNSAHYTQFDSDNDSVDDTNIVTVSGTTVTFANAWVLANQDKEVKVTLKTKINANAITVDNTNTARLNYDNDYYTGNGSDHIDDTVHVYSTKLEVVKSFSDGPSTYPVATFTLYYGSKDASNVVATGSTSSTNNTITFNELAAGSYILEETNTPDGYVKADDVSFTIAADKPGTVYDGTYTLSASEGTVSLQGSDKYVQASVSNVKGKTLPGTGGMGTILFTVGGAAVVLLAGALFVVYMRRRKVEE